MDFNLSTYSSFLKEDLDGSVVISMISEINFRRFFWLSIEILAQFSAIGKFFAALRSPG